MHPTPRVAERRLYDTPCPGLASLRDATLLPPPPWAEVHGYRHSLAPRGKTPCSVKPSVGGFEGENSGSLLFSRFRWKAQAETGTNAQGKLGLLKKRMLAYITGSVDQKLLLLQNEYLVAENRILK